MTEVDQPIQVIKALYAARSADSGNDYGVAKLFSDLIASGAKVPFLSSTSIEKIPNNSLIRLRGMVQDMLNPELYCSEYRTAGGSWHTGRYQDEITDHQLSHGPDVRYGDRKPFVIIPVPGESQWISQLLNNDSSSLDANNTAAGAASKRAREEADDISMMVTEATTTDMENETATAIDSAASRPRTEDKSSTAPAAESNNNKPSTATFPAGACMVYVYGSDDAIKLNDVVEIVGILSHAPELAAAHLEQANNNGQDGPTSMLDEEMLAAHPPTSQVPRIHAVVIKKQDSAYPESLIQNPSNEVRSRAVGFLSMILGGDDVAAQYLLLQLVGAVHKRSKDGAVGVFPLNLTNCPAAESTTLSPLGDALATALSFLAPRVVSLPLTLENLNKGSWIPRRGADETLMTTGALQIASGTQILADETVMQSGQLNETGLRNLGALQGIMQNQKLGYDFQFFVMDQPTDAPVTILSTARTMLKGAGEVVVPLTPTAPVAADGAAVAAAVVSGNSDVESIREYLAAARAVATEFSIPEAVAKEVENELAAAKQKDSSLTPEHFHLWLNMARLLAVSYGEQELTMERWNEALKLEGARRERLPQAAAGSA